MLISYTKSAFFALWRRMMPIYLGSQSSGRKAHIESLKPLISAALAEGLEVGAIHNHFFYEEPRIFKQ
jgi:hypothetical protein